MAWFCAATGVARHALRRSLIARATPGTSATRSAGFGTSALSRRASAPARRAVPLTDSFLDGTSSVYLEELQPAWEADPSSVDESWDNFFRNLLGQAAPSAGLSGQTIQERMQHLLLVRAYQVNGHMKARLDPLGLDDRSVLEGFDLSNYGFTESDLDREFFLGVWKIFGLFENRPVLTLREILSKLDQKYCGPIGYESMKCNLLRDMFQSDVVVHLICCPQFGHSEIDEPSSTQPTKTCKAIAAQAMGHPVLMFGSRSGNIFKSKRMAPLGTHKRAFSSMRQAPVIRQLKCYDDHEIQSIKWEYLADCIIKGDSIMTPIDLSGLMRLQDVFSCGGFRTGDLAVDFLRQGAGLVTWNLMRGVNVSKLMKLENLLWSAEMRCLMFKEYHLAEDDEDKACPYRALYDAFDKAVELCTGHKLKNLPYPLPWQLDDFLKYLLDAGVTDKRVITTHPVTRFPGERMQRKMGLNQLLRRRLMYEFGSAGGSRANRIFCELGKVFPVKLLTDEGLQPAIDYWARKASEQRGDYIKFPSAVSPVTKRLSKKGYELHGLQ
ncbi:hypothetical protein ACQ4PT_003732 [Festuca glaucescens]